MIILSVTTDYISFHAVVEISGEFINQTHNSVSWVSHAVIGFTGFATFINCISIIFSTEYAISKKASWICTNQLWDKWTMVSRVSLQRKKFIVPWRGGRKLTNATNHFVHKASGGCGCSTVAIDVQSNTPNSFKFSFQNDGWSSKSCLEEKHMAVIISVHQFLAKRTLFSFVPATLSTQDCSSLNCFQFTKYTIHVYLNKKSSQQVSILICGMISAPNSILMCACKRCEIYLSINVSQMDILESFLIFHSYEVLILYSFNTLQNTQRFTMWNAQGKKRTLLHWTHLVPKQWHSCLGENLGNINAYSHTNDLWYISRSTFTL